MSVCIELRLHRQSSRNDESPDPRPPNDVAATGGLLDEGDEGATSLVCQMAPSRAAALPVCAVTDDLVASDFPLKLLVEPADLSRSGRT